MRLIVSDFMSLDGVVQAPGQPQDDPDGGFAHGGLSTQYFDPYTMGPVPMKSWTEPRRCFSVVAPGRSWLQRGPSGPGDSFADRMQSPSILPPVR